MLQKSDYILGYARIIHMWIGEICGLNPSISEVQELESIYGNVSPDDIFTKLEWQLLVPTTISGEVEK